MDETLERRLRLLAELIAGSPHNLVSRGEREHVYDRHILECLAYADAIAPAAGQRWIDVGTGGGLPGLVLAAAYPETAWVLVDSVRKKADAVQVFASEMGLGNVTVLAERAETLAHDSAWRAGFDGAISRAVAALPALLELLSGFVRQNGLVVAAKGPRWEAELGDAQVAISQLGLVQEAVLPIPVATRPTWLVIMRRQGTLPRTFPRRPGTPRSHPLGGC